MIIRPWPPNGTIMGGATEPGATTPRTTGAPACGAPDAEQLADELRTIATCILGFTELLRGPDLAPADRQVYLGILHEQATRLALLVEALDGAADAGSDAPSE